MFRHWMTLTLVVCSLAACAANATPQMIGSAPLRTAQSTPIGFATKPGATPWPTLWHPTPTPGWYPSPVPGGVWITVQDTYLDVEVADPANAARRVAQLTVDYGGSLASSQSWYQDGREHITMNLSVPVAQLGALRNAIVGLGTLRGESATPYSIVVEPWQNEWNTYATLSVVLRPTPPPAWPTLMGWDPARTFGEAFRVFFGLFTGLADVGIWVLVVCGPFALMLAGGVWLVRRVRK